MAFDIWFRDNLAAVLTGITRGLVKGSLASGANVEYLRGILDFSQAAAAAFGVEWAQIEGEVRTCADDDLFDVVCKTLPGGGM